MTTATANFADQLPLVSALPVDHLFDMHVDLQPAQLIETPVGTRLTFIVERGVIDGPKLQRRSSFPGAVTGCWQAVTASGGWTCGRRSAPTTEY